MNTFHNDRITSARLLTFATDLWAKIKSTFYAKGESIGASDLPTISKDKLSSDVQTSLGKADTALQSFTETDPTVPSWAKASSKPTYTASEVGAATSTDITNAINALDVSSVGGSGKYITTISETNGKISATSADFPAIPDVSGKLNVDGSNGTAAGVSALINKLTVGSDDSQGNDYFICQYAGGGTEHTNYYRRPISKLWNYIKDQISSVLGLTSTQYNGKAATATTASFANFPNKGGTSDTIDFNSTTFFTKIGMSVGQTLTFKTYSASSGSYCTNPPVGGWIMCIASYLSTNYGWVIVIGNGATDNIYKRFLNNGTWGSWQRLVHMGNSTSAVGSSSQPVYVNANGQVTACNVYYA